MSGASKALPIPWFLSPARTKLSWSRDMTTYRWESVAAGAWSGQRYWSDPQRPRPDSYMVWADATGFADIAPDPGEVETVPVLIELKLGKTAAAWAKAVKDLRCVSVAD